MSEHGEPWRVDCFASTNETYDKDGKWIFSEKNFDGKDSGGNSERAATCVNAFYDEQTGKSIENPQEFVDLRD